jgi:hypothetical protein
MIFRHYILFTFLILSSTLLTQDDCLDCQGECMVLTVGGGTADWGISWILLNENGDTISLGGAPYEENICIDDGCYEMVMSSQLFNGWAGGTWTILNTDDQVLASGAMNQINGPVSQLFSVGGEMGCTDPEAGNYNPNATCNDEQCFYCNDGESLLLMEMYDEYVNGWNGALYIVTDFETGDTLITGTLADGDYGLDGFCLPNGCYNLYTGGGGTDYKNSFVLTDVNGTVLLSGEDTWGPEGFTIGEEICEIPGCTDPNCWNYNQFALIDNGSCECPPPNNMCADAIPLTCGEAYSGTTEFSSDDQGFIGSQCAVEEVTGPGVWFTIEGEGSQLVASLCGSNYDTKIFVYSSIDGCDDLSCTASNNDYCGFQSQIH